MKYSKTSNILGYSSRPSKEKGGKKKKILYEAYNFGLFVKIVRLFD